MPHREPLILVGSSVRAAAQSAFRTGFEPCCIDQFGDEDLRQIAAKLRVVTDWPEGIKGAFADIPDANWIYTGALENNPQLIATLSRTNQLLGCGPELLRRLRDPEWVADTLTRASIPSLSVVVPAASIAVGSPIPEISEAADWLVKPVSSAAGIGIHKFSSDSPLSQDSAPCYLQKKANGRGISGLYLGCGTSAPLLGMCEQICGEPSAGASGYLYCGSLGPLSEHDILSSVFAQAQRIGLAIVERLAAEALNLNGLFGIDFVLESDTGNSNTGDSAAGELWTLEINPRYPASAELYERAFGWPLMRWHVDACRQSSIPTGAKRFDGEPVANPQGKLIVYAPRDFVAPDIVPVVKELDCSLGEHLSVADVPQAGTLIRHDQPICTLLTEGPRIEQCRDRLISGAIALRNFIAGIAG